MQKRTIIILTTSAAVLVGLCIGLAPHFTYAIRESALEKAIVDNDLIKFEALTRSVPPNFLHKADYDTLVKLSCRFGRPEMLRLLVGDLSGDTNFFSGKPDLLFEAIGSGNPDVVRYLLEHGASVFVSDQVGTSPISVSVWSKKPKAVEIIRLLIRAGAKVELSSGLKSAIRIGQTNVIELLLDACEARSQFDHRQVAELMKWCENNEQQTRAFLSNYFNTVPTNN
jgi:hypothetical protein